jgi:tRNA (guanine37-N1)-methyltransferase
MSLAQKITVVLVVIIKTSLFFRLPGAFSLGRRELGSSKSRVLSNRFLWIPRRSVPSQRDTYFHSLSLSRRRSLIVDMTSTDGRAGGTPRVAFCGVASSSSPRNNGGSMPANGAGANCEGLDRSAFDETLDLVALRIPAKLCTEYLRELKGVIFSRSRMKRIFNDNSEGGKDKRLVLLKPEITLDDFKAGGGGGIQQQHIDFVTRHGGEPVPFSLQLGYENLGVDEVLKAVLPQGVEVPSSFEQAGHVAHVNIRDEVLPYKQVIGQVILDKNYPQIKTVVNKLGQISNEYRTFPLEVIAGQQDLHVSLKESGANFSFNFADVYWNSRLQMEHKRVIDLIRARSATSVEPLVVADMMAGIGPFAVPLAMPFSDVQKDSTKKNECEEDGSAGQGKREADSTAKKGKKQQQQQRNPSIQVHANDLNPASYAAMLHNAKINKIKHVEPKISGDDVDCTDEVGSDAPLLVYNQCGRAFLRALVAHTRVLPNEILMNLPANATDFLDSMVGLAVLAGVKKEGETHASGSHGGRTARPVMPRVHVYGFSSADDPIADMAERACGRMGCSIAALGVRDTSSNVASPGKWTGHLVRDVAPKKLMICLSFFVPEEVAYAAPPSDSESNKRKREN